MSTTNNKARVLNTRISLRLDSETNWEKSEKPLLPGEMAMSYNAVDSKWDAEKHQYVFKNFKFKVGQTKSDGSLCKWSELAFVNPITLDDETKKELVDEIEKTLAGKYMTIADFIEFKDSLIGKVVTGWKVDNELLSLERLTEFKMYD